MIKRFSLATQVALIVALALFVAQAVNLALAARNHHDQLINDAALPAVERIAFAIDNADRLEGRLGDWPRRGRVGRRMRATISDKAPTGEGVHRLPVAETVVRDGLTQRGVSVRNVAVVRLPTSERRRRQSLLVAAQMDDGRWISVRGPGPRPLGPVLGVLVAQYFLIGLIVLLPTLWLLRRTGRSLARVTQSARRFDGMSAPEPVPLEGPRDIRALIAAMNAMEARIADMIGEKDVMLGAIGHDLRTPITALRIEAESIEDDDRRVAMVTQIEGLHEQFEQILEFARLGRASGQKIDIALETLLRSLAQAYGGKVQIGAIAPVRVRAQQGPLRRAIANLIDNALQYGGDAVIGASADGDMAIISVRDHGPGIAPENRERAMMPFGRLDASRNTASGGHGLGLAIVSAVARAQGGRLELADPADGPGLDARLYIPRLS